MGRERGSLRELGRMVAASQDEALERVDSAARRARLVLAARAPRKSRAKSWWRASAALVAVVALAFVFFFRPRPIAFRSGDANPGVIGAWIEGGRIVSFSEGTQIELDREARARVASIDERGATCVLESGRMTAAVVHKARARWSILAGPFEVHVTGTRFETAWDPGSEAFELVLEEGSVFVTGPLLGDGRAVQPGERLRVSVKTQELALSRMEIAPLASAAVTSSAEAPPMETESARIPPSIADTARASAPRRRPSWQELAARGAYKEAMATAETEDFDAIIARSSARDLATLGDVARLSGDGDRAVKALSAIRSRFSGSNESATAAFVLGRLAFERGQYGAAEAWFATYLSEQPGGPFAREAEGRVLECKQHRGDLEGAREAAIRYLDRYPNGPHAAKARNLLDPSDD